MHTPKAGNNFHLSAITKDQAKDSGMALVLISLLCAYFSNREVYIILSIVLLLFSMIAPKIFTPFAKIWFGLSNLLGAAMSKVVLALLFFLLVTPIGLIKKLFTPDPLRIREWGKEEQSAFRVRDTSFEPEDIEKPY
ncbi:MAG: SxtJ family membrane protein [Desulforhopalus sp.]